VSRFGKRFSTVDVKGAVAAAKPDNLFVRDQGVMIGNGEIWMNEVGGSMNGDGRSFDNVAAQRAR
jgi:hypothetical protein